MLGAPRRLYVGVLGPLELRMGTADGPPVTVPPGRQTRLLAVLLLAGGRGVSADRLTDELWEEDAPEDVRAALHTTVARLRRALGGAGDLVVRRPPGYALDTTAVTTDAETFRELRVQARTAAPAQAAELLEAALALWRGPAWDGFADDLARAEAVQLEEARRQAREDRAAALLAAGRPGEAVPALEALVEEQPLRERGVSLLMEASHRFGAIDSALAAYGRHRERLAEELGLDPSPALARLHETILRREGGVALPASAGTEARPTTAPPPPAEDLVGRSEQLHTLATTLAASRLVTVVGPGGVGKTALTRRLAADTDGPVWWVDLAALTDATAVAGAVTRALGIDVHPGTSTEAALRQGVAHLEGLLVLDNCEHLLGAVAETIELVLAAGRRLRTVATSRERIGVAQERVFPLPPLRLPGPDVVDADAPAVELFLQRARAVAPDVGLDEAGLREIGDICRRLDGLPLAIELAASRVGTLSLDDLARRLDARFSLLRHPRGAARHSTLAAAIAWSYDLLTAPEQAAFAQLSVFAGAFDLEAAERVVAGPGLPPEDVADVVARLVDRSLVTRPGSSGAGRYRMLETIRGYAASRLTFEDRTAVSIRHADWVADAVAAARVGLQGPEEARWADRCADLLPDVRRALEYAVAAGDPALAGRLLTPLHRWAYFRLRGDVLDLVWPVLALPGPPQPAVLAVAAAAAWLAGRLEEAARWARQAITTAGDSDAPAAAFAHDTLGDALVGLGELAAAETAYRRGVGVTAALGWTDDAALGLIGAALARLYAGLDATAVLAEVEAAARTASPTIRAWARYVDGEALADTDPEAALAALAEARRLATDVGSLLVAGVSATAATAVLGRSGPLAPPTYAAFVEAVDHWLATGGFSLLLTCLRNLVPLLSRAGADRAVLELAASLAVDPSDHPSYGGEADRLAEAIARARRRLPAAEADHAWRTGTARDTEAAGRAAQQVLRDLIATGG